MFIVLNQQVNYVSKLLLFSFCFFLEFDCSESISNWTHGSRGSGFKSTTWYPASSALNPLVYRIGGVGGIESSVSNSKDISTKIKLDSTNWIDIK